MSDSVSLSGVIVSLLMVTCVGVGAQVSVDLSGLVAFKASADVGGRLDSSWTPSRNQCQWKGVKECQDGRVRKLVLENLELNGTFPANTLNKLDQLRVLSLKGNGLTGPIPDLSGLRNLKILYLNHNKFNGSFPASIAGLHRLKVVYLSDNFIGGEIPAALTGLQRLYVLCVENNRLSGRIPAFKQSSLTFLNVSNNKLSGPVPETALLTLLNSSSFSGNPGLCGRIVRKPCGGGAPVGSPIGAIFAPAKKVSGKLGRGKIVAIAVGGAVGLAAILSVAILLVYWRRRKQPDSEAKGGGENTNGKERAESSSDRYSRKSKSRSPGAVDVQGGGSLVFSAGETQIYSLEDLLRASAVILGTGSVGSTYKAVMESGLIVTVKRVKNSDRISRGEMEKHMEMVGNVRHPHIVSLRSYFRAKEESLLVYDYYPNGSLFSLIHGTRPSTGKPRPKPLHWTSCLKIAEDVAQGAAYLHTCRLVHGNLKSANVLIGSDMEACVTDYSLVVFDPDAGDAEPANGSAYRAPECEALNKATFNADVYSFGVVLLEILSGRTPMQSVIRSEDLPRWVKSARQEDRDEHSGSGSGSDGSEEKLTALLNVAMACVAPSPDLRPSMRDVVRMIQQVRDSHPSSHSSDHSPARWSDTIHCLSRDHGSDHSERD